MALCVNVANEWTDRHNVRANTARRTDCAKVSK